VIVIIPLEVSYSSALREMSTDFFGSPVEISGRTPAYAPAHRVQPVRDHGAEALRPAEDGQHEPDVVGLAVVEQVAAAGGPAGQGGQQLDDLLPGDHPVARRTPVGVVARAAAGQGRDPVQRHRVVHVQAEPDEPVGPGAVERRHDERQRPHQMRGQRDVDLALQQRLADQAEVEVLQVAQAAVDELART
jgi:hypothetical protein